MYNSVNYEDGWRKKEKKCEKLKNLLFHYFTLEIFNSGVFLPITKTPNYSTGAPNSVNYTQDFMCIKYKAFLPCKQHPIVNVEAFYNTLSLYFKLNYVS